MARWQPRVEAPVTYDYGRYTVCKGGPWSQGPVMLQQLALMKQFGLDRVDPTSADFIHTLVECSKLAFADRDTFYGDPDFVKVPLTTLLSDAYNAARKKLVGDTASMEQRPGNIPGYGMPACGARAGRQAHRGSRRRRADGRAPGWETRRGARAPRRAGRRGARSLRTHARRHRAFRHHRPRRQHGVGDAVGRLAAILAGDSGAGVLSGHARTAVLAATRAIPTRSRPASGRARR